MYFLALSLLAAEMAICTPETSAGQESREGVHAEHEADDERRQHHQRSRGDHHA